MSVTVGIPSPLRQFTGGAHAVQADGATVAAVLAELTSSFPALAENLFAGGEKGGRLHPFVHVFVNGRDVRDQAGLETAVADGGEVLILQAISGG